MTPTAEELRIRYRRLAENPHLRALGKWRGDDGSEDWTFMILPTDPRAAKLFRLIGALATELNHARVCAVDDRGLRRVAIENALCRSIRTVYGPCPKDRPVTLWPSFHRAAASLANGLRTVRSRDALAWFAETGDVGKFYTRFAPLLDAESGLAGALESAAGASRGK